MLTRKHAVLAVGLTMFGHAAAATCDTSYQAGQQVTITPRSDKDKNGDPYSGPGLLIDTPRQFGCVYVIQRPDGGFATVPPERLVPGG